MKNTENLKAHEESVKLFHNETLDNLTKTHSAIPISLFVLYAIGLLIYTKLKTDLGNLEVVGLFFGGLLLFTFTEYWMHRKLYHIPKTSDRNKRLQYIMHGAHHDAPKDKNRLAMPPALSIAVGTVLLVLFRAILGKFAFSVLAGFMVGYAAYLFVHYIVHIFRPPNNFLKALWTNHAIHHYKDDTVMFGVSTPLWDYIFGTVPKKNMGKKQVEVKV
jgi:sterol desaturase/sphingolipid hydroxylase (fatty acid hydroxylase superfamily)